MKFKFKTLLISLLYFSCLSIYAQKTVVVDSSDPNFRTVIPGAEYKAGSFYQFLWGRHYRKEWTTPVKVPIINLDTEQGGLTATEQGGGRQSKTLRLKDKNGKQYVLRTINKDYGGALPEIARGTFVERLAKDQVSTGHPFSAITVPPMIQASGVFHTNPKIVFVPYTPSMGKFNETFANTLCLFEERPDDNQEDAENFGFAEDVKGTEKMFKKLFEESDHRVDQKSFVKARLFDMFLGDWGRHDDQWRWAKFDSGDYKIYKPIPRDRDQAYTKFDGALMKKILNAEALEHLQSFDYDIKNVKKYNFPARYIDRQLTNEVKKEDWVNIAKELQQNITDDIIEKGVKEFPPEMYSITGDDIMAKLKSRKTHLVKYAEKYYRYLTKQVEIVGTEKNELFHIKRSKDQTQISLYDLNKEGLPKETSYYSRIFYSNETNEIRLYGLSGNDIYKIEGEENSIRIRIIGGGERDSLINTSSSKGHLKYYDDYNNVIIGDVQKRLSDNIAIHDYEYQAYRENSGTVIKLPTFSNLRGIFLRLGYSYTKQGWRKEPFNWRQSLIFNYSLFNKSFGGNYDAQFNELIGKWNLLVSARYDQLLQHYFFGIGNETKMVNDRIYYEQFTEELMTEVGLNRVFGRYHSFTVSGFFEKWNPKRIEGKFSSQNLPMGDLTAFDSKKFVGADVDYTYFKTNHPVVPTKGFGITVNARHSENLTQKDKSYNRYSGLMGVYVPLFGDFSLALRTGGVTVTGNPEFYQLAMLGGGNDLRGYFRERFYGKTSFYSNNEFRWMRDIKSYLFNGKIGLIAFLDKARVWQPGEDSKKWHTGYGAGFMFAPFNRLSLTTYYGISEEGNRLHFRLRTFF